PCCFAPVFEDSTISRHRRESGSDDAVTNVPVPIERESGGYLSVARVEGSMDPGLVVISVIAVAIAVGWAVAAPSRRRGVGPWRLRERFGPEYEQPVARSDNRRAAEKELRGREESRSGFEVTPLNEEDAASYRQAWTDIRLRFVDQPVEVVGQADRLVVQIM